MMFWNDGSWGWGAWMFMVLCIVAAIGLIAWFGALALKSASSPSADSRAQPDAESVLAERFARGEIDEAEFRTRRSVLRGDRTDSAETPTPP